MHLSPQLDVPGVDVLLQCQVYEPVLHLILHHAVPLRPHQFHRRMNIYVTVESYKR